MLGLPPERASEEACVIEHEISEEAANRLSDCLPEKESCFQCVGRRNRKKFAKNGGGLPNNHNLISFSEKETVKVMYMPKKGLLL